MKAILSDFKDFKRIKHRGGIKNYFCFFFSFFKKLKFDRSHWKLFCKKDVLRCIFAWEFEPLWIVQSRGTLTKLGALLKVCLLAWDIDVFWIIIWRVNSKQPEILYSGKDLHIFLGSLLPEKKALFFSILQKQLSRGVL